ncbi:MAG: hypothetical protein B6I24_02080 [Bacteroidetes bacterium 4572_128]|nr:MAG: hypothetical protein B6I24_02080 [Bacteroidetes bacterium 4572_128]
MAFFMLMSFGFLTSCTEDDEDPVIKPSITVTEVVASAYEQGTTVTYTIVIGSNEKLKTFKVIPSILGGEGTALTATTADLFEVEDSITTDNIDISTKNETLTYVYIVPLTNTGDVTITFKVTDAETSNEVVKTFTIVEATPEGTDFGIEANGTIGHTWGQDDAAFNLVSGTTLAAGDVEANKDMKNVSPSNGDFVNGWEAGTGNATTFVKVTDFNYETGTVEDAIALFIGGDTIVTGVAVNDIYLARLRNGETYAAIKITEVNTEDNLKVGEKGFIRFSYKKGSVVVK